MDGRSTLRLNTNAVRARLYWWRLRLGNAGLAALALAVVGLATTAFGLRRAGEQAEIAHRLSQETPLPVTARFTPSETRDDARSLLQRLPTAEQRGTDIALLMQHSRRHGLIGARTQYRLLEADAAAIDRLEISLAATQSYESWRAFMVAMLNQLPHVAVSSASWSRAGIESDQLEGRIVFVLHHRRSP